MRPKNDGKERAKWNRSDLTTVRNCAIVRSVAIALLAKIGVYTMYIHAHKWLVVLSINDSYWEC
jgi:hypothetical protein